MTQENWQVRKAKPADAGRIVELACSHNEFLMPYILNEFVVRNYIDQFLVASRLIFKDPICHQVGGAVHFISANVNGSNMAKCDKVCCFLLNIKQVPEDVVDQFVLNKGKIAFLGQIVCPGKGSFFAILEELKKLYDELWCWMSVVGPSYESYKRYGFKFMEERTFWNIYKCGYSTFTLGKWIKGEVPEGRFNRGG